MMQRIDCLVHGSFNTERSENKDCPRCADMERNSMRDLKPYRHITEKEQQNYELEKLEEKLKSEQLLKNSAGEVYIYTPKEGRKDDTEKPDLSLLPKEFLEEVAKAFMHGEKKYGRYNYRSGMAWHRLVAALLRHVSAFNEGEDNDAESGHSHLGHAGACLAMLLVYQTHSLGTDTRYKK